MKRFIIILTLVGSTFFTSSYANDVKTSPAAEQSFQNAFYGAKEVAWEQVGILHKATFVLDGQYRSAFYAGDGDLIAITQNIAASTLPKGLQASLKSELQGRWITNLFVVSIEGDNTYYVTLENADTTVTLKSAGTKKWAVYQHTDK
jgi:hypothetical protein